MKTKVRNNPESVYVASGYEQIGTRLKLNRERLILTQLSVSQANAQSVNDRIDSITGDNVITDAEKTSLARDLDALKRDFMILGNEVLEADIGDTDEYRNCESIYNELIALMGKIVSSKGDYSGYDVQRLAELYTQYNESAGAVEAIIVDQRASAELVNRYSSRTEVLVEMNPQSLVYGEACAVSMSVTYEGESVTVDDDMVAFGITGLASGFTTSMITIDMTLYPNAQIRNYSSITNTVEVVNAQAFSISYSAVGDSGIAVNCEVTIDTSTVQF